MQIRPHVFSGSNTGLIMLLSSSSTNKPISTPFPRSRPLSLQLRISSIRSEAFVAADVDALNFLLLIVLVVLITARAER